MPAFVGALTHIKRTAIVSSPMDEFGSASKDHQQRATAS